MSCVLIHMWGNSMAKYLIQDIHNFTHLPQTKNGNAPNFFCSHVPCGILLHYNLKMLLPNLKSEVALEPSGYTKCHRMFRKTQINANLVVSD